MKTFNCPDCNNSVFFENTHCEVCKTLLAYNPRTENFEAIKTKENLCANHQLNICNWILDTNSHEKFCLACSLNRKVPNFKDLEKFTKWKDLEAAKHRLIYQLLKFKLPLTPKLKNEHGIAFDFLSDNNKHNAVTGHANGVVTILLSEADSVHREFLRKKMQESYRTLVGHFRHEIGHYYWEVLFDKNNIQKFRNMFGDETLDYSKALDVHYKNGAPNNWNQNFISEYASSHPWEDWAETWAHYLHLMDTLETAFSFDVSLQQKGGLYNTKINIKCPNPYTTDSFNVIFESNVALTCMANSLNRAMGLPDIYPFIIPQPVFHKLNFIHELLTLRYK